MLQEIWTAAALVSCVAFELPWHAIHARTAGAGVWQAVGWCAAVPRMCASPAHSRLCHPRDLHGVAGTGVLMAAAVAVLTMDTLTPLPQKTVWWWQRESCATTAHSMCARWAFRRRRRAQTCLWRPRCVCLCVCVYLCACVCAIL